jgi:hypothetical protein
MLLTRQVIFTIFITLCLLFVTVKITEANFEVEGTIGTTFTITGSDFGIKKPKVYIEYEKRPGVFKKAYAKVKTWSATSITCIWTATLSSGIYNVWVTPNIKKSHPMSVGTFTLMAPIIDGVTPEILSPGLTVTIDGKFFTNKKPAIYLKDTGSQKRYICKVLSFEMAPSTGISSLHFLVPKVISGKYEIVLKTKIGETSFTPAIPPSAPKDIMVTPEVEKISINWDEVSRATAYNIYWSETAGVTKLTGTKISNATAPYLHTQLKSGVTYYYVITAVNSFGESSESNEVSNIPKAPPSANFVGPLSALRGQTVEFDASESSTGNDYIASYTFDFGDGSPLVTQSCPLFTHIYNQLGTFITSLTVTDNQGAIASIKGEITIGIVLSQPVNISNTSSNSKGEDFAIDSEGAINVVWQEDGGDILFSRSDDRGDTFSAPKAVVPRDPYYCLDADQMKIANTNSAIHLTWTLFDTCTGGAEIVYARSTDKGKSFPDPFFVSNFDNVNSYSPSIATNGVDTIGIGWNDANLDFEHPITGEGGYFTISSDNGINFSTPKLLVPAFFSGEPIIGMYSQNTYIAWAQGDLSSTIFFSRSFDGSISFSPPLRVSDYSEHTWNPQMILDSSGNIYMVWAAGSALDKNVKILFSKSTNQGVSFSPPLVISSAFPNSFCPSIAIDDEGQIYITWTISDGGYQYACQSYLSVSVDNGNSFSVPLKIPFMSEFATCPTIVAGKSSQINLLWADSPAKIKTEWEKMDIFYSKVTISIR